MTRALPLLLGALLALSACTTNGPRKTVSADGWETSATYECNWKEDGNWLRRGCVANRPFFPYLGGDSCRGISPAGMILTVVPVVLDLTLSPIAYYFNRDCRLVSKDQRYVGTPASRKREQEAQAARAKQDTEAEQRRRAEREAQERKLKAEADELALLFPPLLDNPKTAAPRPDDFALIVGIEGYRSLPKADYAENDARLAASYLRSLGVPAANIVTLTGAGASRADIAKYLEEWLPANVKPGSRVWFYYSGHGAPDPVTGAAYLVPWDGDAAFLKSTAFPLGQVYKTLSALPAKESVVLLDACFSGAGGRSVLVAGARPLVLVGEEEKAPERVSVLSASGAREIAGGLDLRKHGLFTYFLLRGMAGEGGATLGELQAWVGSKVAETARRSNRDQHPRLLGDPSLRLY